METLIIYLLKMGLISGVLTGYYFLVLRNRTFHSYNRWYLLGGLGLSLGLPLVRINWDPWVLFRKPVETQVVYGWKAVETTGGISWPTVVGCVAALVSLGLFVLWLVRIVRVYRLVARHAVLRMEGYELVETDDPRAPFSFLTYLFWRREMDPQEPVNKKIFYHELAHITGRHSWDGLFAQVVVCLFWMNPFFWLMRRELSVVHEFIADAASGMEGDTEGFARMLLQSIAGGRFLEPVHGFFQSPIKRRLVMISKTRSGRSLMRKALVAPVVLAVALAVACNKDQASNSLDQAKLQKETQDKLAQQMLAKIVPDEKMVTLVYLKDSNGVKLKRQLEFKLDSIKIDGVNRINLKLVPPPPPPSPAKDGENHKGEPVVVFDAANAPK